MHIGICDDELFFHKLLTQEIDRYAQSRALIVTYHNFTSGHDLLRYLSISTNVKPDVIFMDYQIDNLNGLDVCERILQSKANIPIIFLSNFPEIVFDSFKVNASRFLVKPINYEKLSESLDNILKLYSTENYIIITHNELSTKLNVDDIYYLEAQNKNTVIRLHNNTIISAHMLSQLETQLPNDRFFRTHKSFIVGLKYIKEYYTSEIIFDNGERASISRYKFNNFKKAYINYLKRYAFEVDVS